MSSVARDLVEKGVRESEKDMSSSLETGYADLMEAELKKKVSLSIYLYVRLSIYLSCRDANELKKKL